MLKNNTKTLVSVSFLQKQLHHQSLTTMPLWGSLVWSSQSAMLRPDLMSHLLFWLLQCLELFVHHFASLSQKIRFVKVEKHSNCGLLDVLLKPSYWQMHFNCRYINYFFSSSIMLLSLSRLNYNFKSFLKMICGPFSLRYHVSVHVKICLCVLRLIE